MFVGITAMSGPQIRYGLEFADRVRAERPGTPIVWGGVHPTLLPEQTAADPRVDVVVRGEGERVVGPLADALAAGEPLDAVAGITFSAGGGNGSGPTVRSTPDAALVDLDAIPVELPYDLLPLPLYSTLQAGRVHLQTSRGCPSRCGFCYNTAFNKRRWRGKSPERVVDEMEWLLRRFPRDEDPRPGRRQLLRRPQARRRPSASSSSAAASSSAGAPTAASTTWRSTTPSSCGLVERAGCMELDFGGESGSARMQDVVCKEVSAEEILTVRRQPAPLGAVHRPVRLLAERPARRDLRRHGEDVRPHGRDGARQPAHAALRDLPLHAVPEPAARRACRRSSAPPQSLAEWGEIEVFHFLPPWHTREYVEKLRSISAVTRWAFYPQSRIDEHGLAFKAAYGAMCGAARLRWRHRAFGFPVELRLANAAAQRLRGFL